MENKEIKNESKKAETTSNYFDSIVKDLKNEANELHKNLVRYRQNKDMNLYISTLKSLRDVMNLIHEYDWQPQFSKYRVNDKDNGGSHYEIATWEQNSDNEVRNHKRYELKSPEDLNNEFNRKGIYCSNGEKHVMTDDEMDDFENKFDKEMNSMKNVFRENMNAFEDMNRSFSNFTHLLP